VTKTITGSDTITVRHLFCEGFEYKPQFKLFLATNHSPIVQADDDAMWRRILIVLPNHVNIVGTFVECLARCQRYFFSSPQLHHDRALEDVNKRICVVAMYRSEEPGGYSTVIITPSLPGKSGRSFEKSGVTLALRVPA
jgi:hypothetical protein